MPQNLWPSDPDEKILFPICLDAGQFVYLMAALERALFDFPDYGVQFLAVRHAALETLAFLDLPENVPCFPLCDIIERKAEFPNAGYNLLTNLDVECGTEYRYPHFCLEVQAAVQDSLGEPEAFYAAIMERYLDKCLAFAITDPIPTYVNTCDTLVATLGTDPTQAEVATYLATCGITVNPGYDWSVTWDLSAAQNSWVAWSASPYPSIPDNRTRFSWSSGNGLITTYGTPGGGSSTNRHYCYGKRIFAQRTLTEIEFTYVCPSGQTGTPVIAFQTYDGGADAVNYGNITLITDGAPHTFALDVTTDQCDLLAFALLGGTASGNPATYVKSVTIRGLGTAP